MRNRTTFISLALAACLLSGAGYAQRSNIYLFDVTSSGSDLLLSKPRYLTAFNAQGYNADPSFFSPTEIYITARLPRASQSNIYKLDLLNRSKTQVTATSESEHLPMRMPDYYTFSAIRPVREGRDSVLRLWQFPIDQTTGGKPVFRGISGIRSYLWLNSMEIVLRKEPDNALVLVNLNTEREEPIEKNVGRYFHLNPANRNLAYVQKGFSSEWKIVEKNLYRVRDAVRPIIATLPGSDCFAITPDGTYLLAKGSKLYKFDRRIGDTEWKEIADLRTYEIRSISQLQVSISAPSPQSSQLTFQLAIVAD